MKFHIPRFVLVVMIVLALFGFFGFLDSLLGATQVSPALRAVIPEAHVAEARIFTGVISPSIESELALGSNRRLVEVRGHIACEEGEQLRIDVTVTQGATGAVARGHTQDVCTGDIQVWTARVVARGPVASVTGAAEACAVAQTRSRGHVTDAYSWCKGVTLVSE
ncbi:MAG TPA: hypothetical protein VK879_09050 [Candidatus Sulfomarinibacteraceae bacterium]|nr:hypothetical protein [Candidatus Sulfomarinibacteraceae bacterium]